MNAPFNPPIVTTIEQLKDLATLIGELDKPGVEDDDRIRHCARAHSIIADMLGPQKSKVYDEKTDEEAQRDISVVGYASAEGDCV